MQTKEDLIKFIQGKSVLYIATKNLDYIRISQEISLLENSGANISVICYNDKNYIRRCLKVFSKLMFHSCRKYDIIFVGFMAQMIIPLFHWKWRRKPVITDFFISIYDTLIFDRKKFRQKGVASFLFKWIDRVTVRKSSYLIADTQNHALYFEEEFHADLQNTYILYLEADEKIYHPMAISKPPEWVDKYLVVFFGSILPVQGIEVLLEAITLLKEFEWIHFLIIGPIDPQHKNNSSDTVTYIDWLPQKDLAQKIAMADLCLAGHFSSTVNKAKRTIPGKAYIYQAMRKRIVLGDSPANHELFKEDNGHYYVKMGDSQALAVTIKHLAEKWKEDI